MTASALVAGVVGMLTLLVVGVFGIGAAPRRPTPMRPSLRGQWRNSTTPVIWSGGGWSGGSGGSGDSGGFSSGGGGDFGGGGASGDW